MHSKHRFLATVKSGLKWSIYFFHEVQVTLSVHMVHKEEEMLQLTRFGFKTSHSVYIFWPVRFSVVFLVEFEHMLWNSVRVRAVTDSIRWGIQHEVWHFMAKYTYDRKEQ